MTKTAHMHTVLRKLRGTIANIILPPRVLFYRREIYFTAASFIFSAASFILFAPRFNIQNKTRGGKIKLAAVK